MTSPHKPLLSYIPFGCADGSAVGAFRIARRSGGRPLAGRHSGQGFDVFCPWHALRSLPFVVDCPMCDLRLARQATQRAERVGLPLAHALATVDLGLLTFKSLADVHWALLAWADALLLIATSAPYVLPLVAVACPEPRHISVTCLPATCHPPPATCRLPHATCYMRHATCNLLHATCYMQNATCNLLHATCYMQPATCNLLHAT